MLLMQSSSRSVSGRQGPLQKMSVSSGGTLMFPLRVNLYASSHLA
uniref:Uncharacterized protein LOC105647438 n=1 Tax=Rhizophora mucronata TaxID=61149 RepID=A0A2P2IJ76_RHIMU